MNISIIGGDLRQKILAELLQKDGYNIQMIGFDKDTEFSDEPDITEISQSNVVILPLPVSYDNITINAPLSKNPINIKDILNNIHNDCILLGGSISEYLKGELDLYGINYSDYFIREELVVQNAIPTALAIW